MPFLSSSWASFLLLLITSLISGVAGRRAISASATILLLILLVLIRSRGGGSGSGSLLLLSLLLLLLLPVLDLVLDEVVERGDGAD